MTQEHLHLPLTPRPFQDGHALTYRLRELHEGLGEFLTQYHDPRSAIEAFARARRMADYAELRDRDGRMMADYAAGHGVHWYCTDSAEQRALSGGECCGLPAPPR